MQWPDGFFLNWSLELGKGHGFEMKGQVSASPGHLKCRAMASDSIRGSLHKPFSGHRVRDGAQEDLVGGVSASQGVEVDAVGGQVHLCTDQAMDPGGATR